VTGMSRAFPLAWIPGLEVTTCSSRTSMALPAISEDSWTLVCVKVGDASERVCICEDTPPGTYSVYWGRSRLHHD
jgi:hypothetical protein